MASAAFRSVFVALVVVVAVSVSCISTLSKAKIAAAAQQQWMAHLKELVCQADPQLCQMKEDSAGLGVDRVPRQLTALYRALMSSSVDTASSLLGLSDQTKAELQSTAAEDPRQVYQKLLEFHKGSTARVEATPVNNAYFGFVPKFHGHALLNASAPFNLSTPCFGQVFVSVELKPYGTSMFAEVSVTLLNKLQLFCSEELYFSLGAMAHEFSESGEGEYRFPFDVSAVVVDPALDWDLHHKGVRVYRFHQGKLERTLEVIATLLLFYPLLINHVESWGAQMNVDFLSNYTKIQPYPVHRGEAGKHVVNLTPGVDFKSGDLFAMMDLDGEGTVEMIGQGTTSGHTAFALQNQTSGEMMVCESIPKGITCTEYHEWIHKKQSANMCINLVPLAKNFSDSFNLAAAWEWVSQTYGNEYGYHNFFFGWIDTKENNYPCFPDSFDRCIVFEHVELVLFFVDGLLPSLANTFAGEALNHRAGTKGLSIPDVFYQAYLKTGIESSELTTVVEEDRWNYTITNRYINGTMQGPSQVCSTFACNTLRKAGVFDSIDGQFECAEIDVWDIFSLKIFDSDRMGSGRPAACVAADPQNPLCQLTCSWTFNLLTDVNSRTPFVNISNHCASGGPSPYDRTGCFGP